jgi:carotenoid 1,2-hydratase
VFSPYYAWAGRKTPLDHCALNVCLYGPGVTRWAMTERRAGAVTASANTLELGPSRVHFEDGALIYDIEEHGAPLPRKVRGRVVIRPEIEQSETFTLDRDGRHVWRPVWPRARVEAHFDSPDLKFAGDGYVDMNAGSEPLEHAFSSWNWSRAPLENGAAILYDSIWPDGAERSLALRINAAGKAEPFEAPPVRALANVGWGVARETRSDSEARVVRTLEDTPFYSRSLVETDLLGGQRLFMHESLDLKRFSSSWVKCLLPFRMPRAF